MKKIFYPLCTLVIMSLVSCNLFIEDEILSDDDFRPVPVHTGEGYDSPVKVIESGCEVTYQFNSNVRVLDQDYQDRYILSAERDKANGIIEIHYDVSTPLEALPVPGEILVSTATEKFPWGCNHEVLYRIYEDGVYKYTLGFVALDDTYKVLHIDGTVKYENEEEGYVMCEGPAAIDEDGNVIERYETAEDEARTRGDDGFEINLGDFAKVSYKNSKFSFEKTTNKTLPTLAMDNGISGDLSISHTYKIEYQLNFDNFDLWERNFTCSMVETTTDIWEITLNGGYTKTIRLWRIPALQGKVVTVGYVVLVFFINIDLSVNFNVTVSANWKREKVIQTTYMMDLYKGTVDKESKTIVDKDLDMFSQLSLGLKFEFYIKVDFQFCMGIYGKILSVRFIPSLIFCNLKVTTPELKITTNGDKTFDITGKEGVEWKPAQLSVTLGVYLDLSLKKLLGKSNTRQVGDAIDEEIIKNLEKPSSYYQNLIDNDNNAFDPNQKHYVKNDKTGKWDKEQTKEGTEEMGLYYTFGPWPLAPTWDLPWYPTIKDNSFKVESKRIPSDNPEEPDKWQFSAQYTIDKVGFLADEKYRSEKDKYSEKEDYVASLMLTEKGKIVREIQPTEYNVIQEGKTFHFIIDDMNDGKEYFIYPVYRKRGDKGEDAYKAFDKYLPLNPTTPSAEITEVVAVGTTLYEDTQNPKNPELYDGRYYYKYRRDFVIDTYTTIVRDAAFADWGVNAHITHGGEQTTIQKKRREASSSKYNTTVKSTTYKQRWIIKTFVDDEDMIVKWNDKYNSNWTTRIEFYCNYKFKGDEYYKTSRPLSPKYLRLLPDGTYEVYDNEYEEPIFKGIFKNIKPVTIPKPENLYITKASCKQHYVNDHNYDWSQEDFIVEANVDYDATYINSVGVKVNRDYQRGLSKAIVPFTGKLENGGVFITKFERTAKQKGVDYVPTVAKLTPYVVDIEGNTFYGPTVETTIEYGHTIECDKNGNVIKDYKTP